MIFTTVCSTFVALLGFLVLSAFAVVVYVDVIIPSRMGSERESTERPAQSPTASRAME